MKEKEEKKKNEWFDWLKAILIALGIAFIVKQFLFAPIVVDGPSMEPTLHDRDYMVVNKISYRFWEPERFDIVVFHATDKKDFIKRVIGLPGEHIAYENDTLLVNGKPVEEPYLKEEKEEIAPSTLTSDFRLEDLPDGYSKIPEGYVLVLGDNRTNSTDSRILGLIPEKELVGKTSVIYWPLNRMSMIGE